LIKFPEEFLFGTSTSAHQIEGDNFYNDWWDWEVRGKFRYRSGKACNHWELYREDIELMAKLGYPAYRFSIEWSRIFPDMNTLNEDALARYREIVDLLKKHGIKPMITFHHFTNPVWFNKIGGWVREENIKYFLRFVEIIADNFSDVEYYLTFNEPNVYVLEGYIEGRWPPGYRSLEIADKVLLNLIKAHNMAYEVLKKKGAKISVAQNIIPFKPGSNKKRDLEKRNLVDKFYNWSFLDGVLKGSFETFRGRYRVREGNMDFIGVNYYTAYIVSHSWNPFKKFIKVEPLKTEYKTTMGYYIYPRGIYEVLKSVRERYGKEIIITENGVAVKDDEVRILSIIRHLQYVHKALSENMSVKGYYYWSFMDNYEWDKGFGQRFGLVEVDYSTFERRPRKSAYVYSEIARTRSISDELLKKYGLVQLD
jgi:beta-glucosidase